MIFTTSGAGIVMRYMELPKASASELEHMVQYEMQQMMPGKDFILQIRKLGITASPEGEKSVKVQVAAMPRELADKYFLLAKSLNLKNCVLDINGNALSKLLNTNTTFNGRTIPTDRSYMLADICTQNISSYIHSIGSY